MYSLRHKELICLFFTLSCKQIVLLKNHDDHQILTPKLSFLPTHVSFCNHLPVFPSLPQYYTKSIFLDNDIVLHVLSPILKDISADLLICSFVFQYRVFLFYLQVYLVKSYSKFSPISLFLSMN